LTTRDDLSTGSVEALAIAARRSLAAIAESWRMPIANNEQLFGTFEFQSWGFVLDLRFGVSRNGR
jgi:hypothetical protein